jgi:hypothetical protein
LFETNRKDRLRSSETSAQFLIGLQYLLGRIVKDETAQNAMKATATMAFMMTAEDLPD